jgi:hypothetical protein
LPIPARVFPGFLKWVQKLQASLIHKSHQKNESS